MKLLKYIIFTFVISAIISSCKKDSSNISTASALNVINASQSSPAVSVNFTLNPINFSLYQVPISYGSSAEFGNPSGSLPLVLISSADTLKPIYKNTLNFPAGSIHSLYIIGNANQPEMMLSEDKIPSYQDSTSGVRFINLAPDSQPITINLQGNPPTQTEFPSVAYKQISDFKGYSAKSAFSANGYTFEIRDAATSNLLTTFTWNFKPFFCNELVIYGLENNTSGNFPINVLQVNYY